MRLPRLALLLAFAPAAFGLSSCVAPGESIQGAGATFPAPLYKRWFLEYYHQHPDVRVNYQAIGSGAGIRQFTEGVVLFGASDAAMSDKEIANVKKTLNREVQLLPMTAGSVVICYNIPDGPKELRLSRKAYLKVFLGQITSWDDSLIADCNPGAKLPKLRITVVRRADGSGTTYAFTNHLNAVGKSLHIPWKGVSKTWPITEMIGARGNPGVTALIQQTPGAIGYLEYGYAELAHLPTAVLENKKGKYIKATPETSQAALKGIKLPKDFRPWIPDPEGAEAYPIVTYTWLLCYKDYRFEPEKGKTLIKVIKFGLTEGQKYSKELGYIPLPEDIAREVLAAAERIKT